MKALIEDDIITIGRYTTPKGTKSCIKHSVYGDYSKLGNPKKPPSLANGGQPAGGGHSQANIDYLESKGIEYKIEKTYKNGVRIGGVENHGEPKKRIGQTGQSWFPETWTEDDVLIAGTYVANNPEAVIEKFDKSTKKLSGYEKYSEYNGVTVGIYVDIEGNVGTIFPDENQRKVGDIK